MRKEKKTLIVEVDVSDKGNDSIDNLIVALRRAGRTHKTEPIIKMSWGPSASPSAR